MTATTARAMQKLARDRQHALDLEARRAAAAKRKAYEALERAQVQGLKQLLHEIRAEAKRGRTSYTKENYNPTGKLCQKLRSKGFGVDSQGRRIYDNDGSWVGEEGPYDLIVTWTLK